MGAGNLGILLMLTAFSLPLHTPLRRQLAALACSLSLLVLVGCENTNTAGSGISFGAPVVDDSALSAKVREALEKSPFTSNQGILVSTRPNDVVRLSGVVDTRTIKGSAEQIALRVEGVNGVINTLHVQ